MAEDHGFELRKEYALRMESQQTQGPRMGRVRHRLTQDAVARFIRNGTQGRHADGGNLYLRVRPGCAPAWTFLYKQPDAQTPREMTLGDARDVTLAMAQELASAARTARAVGSDPLEARHAKRRAAADTRAAEKRAKARERHT